MPVNKDFYMLAGSSGQSTGYTINQSIRFNDDDSPELTKTYSGAGSRTTQTFSVWFKLGNIQSSSGFNFYNGGTGTSDTTWSGISIYDHKIYLQGYNTNWKITTRLLRDHSAWYHLVYNWDTTNSIASERVRLYINGQRETDFSTDNNPSASASSGIGQAAKHSIGNQTRAVGYGYADAYFAEMHFLDGYAYGPEYFGEFDDYDNWIPKEYTGSYGTNGFFIDGRDSSDLGDDESGNGNDYASSGLAAHDQVLDTPTNNFPTINVLDFVIRNAAGSVPLSEGNLKFTGSNSTSVYGTYNCTIPVPDSGGWYFEMVATSIGSQEKQSQYIYVGNIGFLSNGNLNGGGSYGSAWSDGDIIGVAVNSSGIWFSINGTYQNSGNPATGSNSAGTPSLPGLILTGDGSATTNSSLTGVLNFGQDGTFAGSKTAQGNKDGSGIGNFYYSVPTGFKALCTTNLFSVGG